MAKAYSIRQNPRLNGLPAHVKTFSSLEIKAAKRQRAALFVDLLDWKSGPRKAGAAIKIGSLRSCRIRLKAGELLTFKSRRKVFNLHKILQDDARARRHLFMDTI